MKYYVNDAPGNKKLHTEKCYNCNEYCKRKDIKEHWLSFDTLGEAIRFCKKNGTYHYCGNCFKGKTKIIVR